jgi:hypothetical protein
MQPLGGCIDLTAQQVDLCAGLVQWPVVPVDWSGDLRVDQRRGLRGVAATEQPLDRVGEDEGGMEIVPEAEVP